MKILRRGAGALALLLVLLPAVSLAIDGDMVIHHDGTTTILPVEQVVSLKYDPSRGMVIQAQQELDFPLSTLEKITFDQLTEVEEGTATPLPIAFQIGAAYPNPFNASTTLPVTLPTAGEVKVRLVNLLGQQLYQASYQLAAGQQKIVLDAVHGGFSEVASGIVLAQIQYAGQSRTMKLVYLK